MVPLRVLSRTNFAESSPSNSLSSSISFTSFRLRTLKLSCRSFSDSRPLFSMTSALFWQNTRGGIPLRKLLRCTEAQKYLSLSPLLATLTHSVSRKSFPCLSYANTRDGGVTPPPNFLSPLVYPERLLRRATRHSPLALTTFKINTCKSVSKQATLTPFRINTYEKRGGRGVPVFSASPASSLQASSLQNLMRHVAPLSPVPSFDCAYFPSPRGCTIQSTEMAVALRGRPQRA